MRRSISAYPSQSKQIQREKISQPAIELKFWVFRLYDNNPKKYVYKATAISSPIVDCLSEKRLITDTKREYCLKGSMDVDQAIVFNYSEEIISAFRNGFPTDWKNLLRQEHKRLHSTVAKRVSNNLAGFPFTVLTNLANFNPGSVASKLPKCDGAKIADNFVSPKSFPKAHSPSPQPTPMNVVCKVNIKKQITSASPNDGLRVSKRSGRVIKQPLQGWMGERIVYDMDGNPIEAHSITTKEEDRPDVSNNLAAICDGLGVGRVEPSRQAQRRSTQPMLARELEKKRRSSKDGGGKQKKKLVDYSDSEDSFLDFVDRVQLSLSPEPRKYSGNKSLLEVDTPIPLKHNLKNRRAIFSPSPQRSDSSEHGSERESEDEPNPKKKRKRDSRRTKKGKSKPNRWSEEEIKRLQIALGAASASKHKIDWRVISRCVSGGERSANECQKQAEKLNLKKISNKNQKPIVKKKKAQNIFGSDSDSESETSSDDSYLARLDNILISPDAPTNTIVKRVVKKKAKDDEEEVQVAYIVEQPDSAKKKEPVVNKNKRWTAEETQRLKNALNLAVNPQTEQDWEVIAKAIANQKTQRTGQACREQAQKIKWKPPTMQHVSKPVYDSPDEPSCSKDSPDKKEKEAWLMLTSLEAETKMSPFLNWTQTTHYWRLSTTPR
uniref:Myb-like domain-containing protein n=1 Tax=Ditylenchus dipsaci TaxID=166011 RepID=A0A915EE99_9BILA